MKTDNEIMSWRRGADHFTKRAGEHTDSSSQLACLLLADYCVYEWSGDRGGPTQEMVQLAEKILGTPLNKTLDDMMANREPAAPPMITEPPAANNYDSALSARLVDKARMLVADTDGEFPFPDMHAVDLAIRLVAPGPKAAAISASECHEITRAVIAAYDRDAFPIRARETITDLADQLEAAGTVRSTEQVMRLTVDEYRALAVAATVVTGRALNPKLKPGELLAVKELAGRVIDRLLAESRAHSLGDGADLRAGAVVLDASAKDIRRACETKGPLP